MGLPAALASISPALVKAGVQLGHPGPGEGEPAGLPFGIPELDELLPDRGIVRGGVVELSVSGASGVATSLALSAVRSVQAQARTLLAADAVPWCAFVDASGTLYAPGVHAAGVDLGRLLVVRPPPEAIGRVSLKLVESGVFPLIVVDTVGTLGKSLPGGLGNFERVVRRLSMGVDGTANSVLLITDERAQRSLPLPVAQRLVIARPSLERLMVRVAKDRRGRVTPARSLHWSRGTPFLAKAAGEGGGTNVRKLA
ncbi:MAG TPA: recombinase A [Polyangiaceae bacterium]